MVKWYSLQGVPDNDPAPMDAGVAGAFVELPAVGSLQGVQSPFTPYAIADLPSESSAIVEDNRERFAPFSTVNDFSTHDSTYDSEPDRPSHESDRLAQDNSYTHDSNGAVNCKFAEISDSSWGFTASDLVVAQAGGCADAQPDPRLTGMTSQDPDGSSTMVGDLCMSTLHSSPNSSYFHAAAPQPAPRALSGSQPASAVGMSAFRSAPPKLGNDLSGNGRSFSNSTLSSSTLTDVSDLSSFHAAPQVDQLWERLQQMKVTSSVDTGIALGQDSRNQAPSCVCDQFRQFGIDNLTTLVESLKTGSGLSAISQASGANSTSQINVPHTTGTGNHAGYGDQSTAAAPTAWAGSSSKRRLAQPKHSGGKSSLGNQNSLRSFSSGKGLLADVSLEDSPQQIEVSQSTDGASMCAMTRPGPSGHSAEQQKHLVVLPANHWQADKVEDRSSKVSSSSSNQWYFYPMGDLFTTTTTSKSSPKRDQRQGTQRPTLIPLGLQDAFRQQMGTFVARSHARQHALAVAQSKRVAERRLRSSTYHPGVSRGSRIATRHRHATGIHAHRSGVGSPHLSRRQMSHTEMVRSSRRKYSSLPEVQQREDRGRTEREREGYRHNAKLFQQRVTAGVLSRHSQH